MARSALGPVAFRPTSPLVGRGTEREAIERALARSRVVTLIGPPGAGKTRLATEVATSRPGAVICGLAAARTRSEVLAEVVHALGLSAQAPEGEVRAASSACPLVVLDNCEQALDAVRAVVDDWRDTRLLLTSRVAMDHAGEELVPVAGLDEEAAVALFLARARVVSPGFDPNAVQLRAVRELVDGLDRLPLGIEMAAARVRVLSPTAIVDRLGAQLDLLRGDETGWGTLRAAIAWSWELLPASHRSALAQSTVFVGGFDLAAAEAVLEVPGGDAVVDVLDDLERASLLMTVEVPALDGELRFRHYVAVRQFAAGYRPQGVEARLAAHYQDRFGDVWRNRRDEPARRTLVELRIEVANLVAVREAVRADADLALATTLVAGLGSRPEDAERMIGESVVRARDDRLRLVALQHQSALRHHLGLDAWEPVTEALAVARSLGDADSEADVLGKMALFAKAEGRFDETERLFGEAIRVAEAAGATRSLAAALDGLGNHQASRYRFAEAEQTLVRAVALAEGAGPLLFAWSLLDLGQVRRLQGRLGEADALHRQALAVSAMAGFATEARAHSMCGTLWLQMGRFDEATAAVTRAA